MSSAPVELSMGDANIYPDDNNANGVPLDLGLADFPNLGSPTSAHFLLEDPNVQLPDSWPHSSQCLPEQPIDVPVTEQHALDAANAGPSRDPSERQKALQSNVDGQNVQPSDDPGAAEFRVSMGGTAGSEGETFLQRFLSLESLLSTSDLLALSPGLPPPGAVPATRRPREKKRRKVPPPGTAPATRHRASKRDEAVQILILQCILQAKQEAKRGTMKGPLWENVSNLLKDNGNSLKPGQCENFWTSATRAVAARRHGDVRNSFYWMFSDDCLKLIQQILEEKRNKAEYRRGGVHAGPSYANQLEVQGPQCNAQHSGADHAEPSHTVNFVVGNEAQGSQSNAEPRGVDRAEPFQVVLSTVEGHGQDARVLLANKATEDVVNPAFESLRRRALQVNSPELSERLTPEFMQTVKAIITDGNLQFLDTLLPSGFILGGDDPVAKLTPHLKKVTDDAVKDVLEPIVRVLVYLEEIQKKRKDVMKDRRLLDVKEKALDESERVQYAIGSAYMNRVLRDGHGG